MKVLNDYLEEILLAVLLSGMTLLIGIQVFMRYFLNDSLTWSEELARYFFIWATYIGVAAGFKHSVHIRVDFLITKLSQNYQRYVNILVYLIVIVFAYIVIVEGYTLVERILKFNQRSSSLGISMAYVYMAPLVGFGLSVIRLLQAIYGEVKAIKRVG
ncbi:TRAP transporter small permease [Pelistega suis]|uniref:TRAP transporter small permease protein n=1 Tax=Pelistega suis TaxID=1631957 RepID=A0A849P999_9BURK|nr:TRAP transporter small permease [Pelistega suis]NOL52573.1 TRAP transporter small permease [Pelistega suis]